MVDYSKLDNDYSEVGGESAYQANSTNGTPTANNSEATSANLFGGSEAALKQGNVDFAEAVKSGDWRGALTATAQAGESLALAPANIAMSSLMNLADWSMKSTIWLTEKAAHGIGSLTGWEAAKNFSPYQHIKDNPEYSLRGSDMSQFLTDSEAYSRHETAYDFAGDLVASGMIFNTTASAVKQGSVAYKAIVGSGVPSSWANKVFWNPDVAANEISALKKTVVKLSQEGINPSAVKPVYSSVANVLKKTVPEAAKETAAAELGFWASGYKHDEFFPEGLTLKQALTYYAGLPLAFGVGLPAVSAASKTRAIFNRGAVRAESKLNQRLFKELEAKGLDQEMRDSYNVSMHDGLVSYGLQGNSAADVATQEAYSLKALKKLKEDSLAKLDNTPVSDIAYQDVNKSFDDLISSVEAKRATAIKELIPSGLSEKDYAFVATATKKSQDLYSNTLAGTKSITLAPNTNKALGEITNNLANKRAELLRLSQSERVKPSNKAKYLEQLQDLQAEGYQLIDENGLVYDATDFHLRWRDSADLSKVKVTSEPVFKGSKVTQPRTSVNVTDSEFSFMKTKKVNADPLGVVRVGSYNDDGKVLGNYMIADTDTGYYDAGWVALNKMFNTLVSKHKVKNGQPKTGVERLLDSNVSYNLRLDTLQPQQADFLANLLNAIGEEQFTKLYKIDEGSKNVALAYASRAYDTSALDLTLSDILRYKQVDAAQQLMRLRAKANASKADKFKFNRYTEDSLFSELTGLKSAVLEDGLANEHIVAEFLEADSKEAMRLVKPSNEMFRGPKRYALQRTSEIGAMTDEINNSLIGRLAENHANKLKTLIGEDNSNTLVSFATKQATALPQYTNNYINTPVSLGYDGDILGKAGKLFLSQEERHGNNVALMATASFNNELSPAITHKINEVLSPLTDLTRPLLKDTEATSQFSNLWQQMRSGYRVAEDGLEFHSELGGYLLKLDESKFGVNSRIAEHTGKFRRVDYSNAIQDGYLPNPVNGEPLVIKESVAKLLTEQDKLNRLLYDGDKQLAQAVGHKEAPFMNYHMPAKDLSKKVIKIIGEEDGRGQFMPQLYVSGATEKQATELAKLELENAGLASKRNWVIKTPEDIHLSTKLIQEDVEKNYFKFVDYSDTLEQAMSNAGKTNGIRLSAGSVATTGTDMFKEFLEANNRALQRQAGRARSVLFSDQINEALAMLGNKTPDSAGYSELNEYIANLTGRNLGVTTKPLKKVYDAFDYVIDQGASAINDFRNLPTIARAKQIAETNNGKLRRSSRMFENAGEVEELYNFGKGIDQGLFDYANVEATRQLGLKKPALSKEFIGNFNRIATNGLLLVGNFGYALMNLVSLGAVMPMVRKSLARLPGEPASEWQARIGAYGKVVGNGENLAIDLASGAIDTLSHYMRNPKEARALIQEASDRGILSSNASLINEVFLNPSDAMLGKSANSIWKQITKIGIKSEEFSRILPFLEGYRIASKSGLPHSSCMSLAKRFMDKTVGNYLASNRPELFQQAAGSLTGLFYTYNHNLVQNGLTLALRGDKDALIAGLAAQQFMFGTQAIPGSELVEDFFIPLGSGGNFYTSLRDAGYNDTFARGIMLGTPSAISGLDFSAKGSINAVAVPGISTPPVWSLATDIASGAYESVKSLAYEKGINPDHLWEIWQTRLPFTAGKSVINLTRGYKVDRNNNVIVDKDQLGGALWWASNLLSMNSVEERLARDGVRRATEYDKWQTEQASQVRNGMVAALRNPSTDPAEALANGIEGYVSAGRDPSQIGTFLKDSFTKVTTSKLEQRAERAEKKKYQTPAQSKLSRSLRLVSQNNRTLNQNNANPKPLSSGYEPTADSETAVKFGDVYSDY